MNERLKELWDKSKISGTHPVFGEYDNYNAERFALLVIDECLRIIDDMADHLATTEVPYTALGAVETVADDIAEYFGIEQ